MTPHALIIEYQGYAAAIARKIHRRAPRGNDVEEMVADAFVGLVAAGNRYREGGDATFKTFAMRHIRGAVLDGLRRRNRTRLRCEKVTFEPLGERTFEAADRDEVDTAMGVAAVLEKPMSGTTREAIGLMLEGATPAEAARAAGMTYMDLYYQLKKKLGE